LFGLCQEDILFIPYSVFNMLNGKFGPFKKAWTKGITPSTSKVHTVPVYISIKSRLLREKPP